MFNRSIQIVYFIPQEIGTNDYILYLLHIHPTEKNIAIILVRNKLVDVGNLIASTFLNQEIKCNIVRLSAVPFPKALLALQQAFDFDVRTGFFLILTNQPSF